MDTLKPGDRITISPNKVTHDRSWTREVHTIQAVNATHVQTTHRDFLFGTISRLFIREEHDFTLAPDFAEPSHPVLLVGEPGEAVSAPLDPTTN